MCVCVEEEGGYTAHTVGKWTKLVSMALPPLPQMIGILLSDGRVLLMLALLQSAHKTHTVMS